MRPINATPIRVMRIIARMNVGGPAVQVSGSMRGFDSTSFDHRLYTGYCAAEEADYLDTVATDVRAPRIASFGRHVSLGGHVRRYTKSEIVDKIKRSGLTITSVQYWNSLLFPFAILSRFLFRNGADLKMPPALLNSLLFYVVSKERVSSYFGWLPGTSLCYYRYRL